MGDSVGWGLRYRLLWFGSSGWPRGVSMVRKWKWYPLTFLPLESPIMILKAFIILFLLYDHAVRFIFMT